MPSPSRGLLTFAGQHPENITHVPEGVGDGAQRAPLRRPRRLRPPRPRRRGVTAAPLAGQQLEVRETVGTGTASSDRKTLS